MRRVPVFLLLAPAACRPVPTADPDASADAPPAVADARADAPPADGPAPDGDGRVDDGTPERRRCTNDLGTALSREHGRLDGRLVSIVPPGTGDCNGDRGHVHLQVEVDGAVYDVAVNIGGPDAMLVAERELALPGGAYAEGWHTSLATALDYVDLDLHATDFAARDPGAMEDLVRAAVDDANHVSIFMIGYGGDGGHNVHRVRSGQDGAIFLRPLDAEPHGLFLRFADQSF